MNRELYEVLTTISMSLRPIIVCSGLFISKKLNNSYPEEAVHFLPYLVIPLLQTIAKEIFSKTRTDIFVLYLWDLPGTPDNNITVTNISMLVYYQIRKPSMIGGVVFATLLGKIQTP